VKTSIPCNLPRRLASDAARGVTTSQRAIAHVRRTCPCGVCSYGRADVVELRQEDPREVLPSRGVVVAMRGRA
jgi:hypothetical protein